MNESTDNKKHFVEFFILSLTLVVCSLLCSAQWMLPTSGTFQTNGLPSRIGSHHSFWAIKIRLAPCVLMSSYLQVKGTKWKVLCFIFCLTQGLTM